MFFGYDLDRSTTANDFKAHLAAKIGCQDIVAYHRYRAGTGLTTLTSTKFKVGVPTKFFASTFSS